MKKLPRELWLIILKEKSRIERRERFDRTVIRLNLKLKKPTLQKITIDINENGILEIMTFEAGGTHIIYSEETIAGNTRHTMITYSKNGYSYKEIWNSSS